MKKNCILGVFFAALLISCNQTDQQTQATVGDTVKSAAEVVSPPIREIDEGKLLGSWVRTDSPYEIRILELRSDGNMLAGYFNPNSINIGRASWSKAETLDIYVELQDTNYPGSNYLLRYFPDQDVLAGKYFQAVEATTYEVSFKRKQ